MIKGHWSVASAKAALSQLIEEAADAPQVIEKRGKPVAVVVSFGEYSLRDSNWQRFLATSAQIRKDGGAALLPARRKPRRDPFR